MAINRTQLINFSNYTEIPDLLTTPNLWLDGFWMFIIFVLWLVVGTTMYFNRKRETNDGDLLQSFAVASFIGIFITVFFGLIRLVEPEVFWIPIVVFLLVDVAFLISKGKKEY